MKNILLVIPYGGVGGMERLALYFYNYYKSKGYLVKGLKIIKLDNDIISFGDDEIYLSDKDFCQMSRFQRFLFYLKCPYKISRVVKKNQISHSVSFGDMANLFSSLSFSGEFKVGSIHALKSSEFVRKSFFNILFKYSYKTSYYFLDKVVCISKAIKEDLVQNCGFIFIDRLQVIYNPHDIRKIRTLAKESISDQFEVELFQNPVVIFIGRLSIQKAPWHLLKAFNKLQQEVPMLKLVFIGDGQDEIRNNLTNMIERYKLQEKVFFLGRKANPFMYLKSSKLLVLSSYYEGTPNVIIEAMSLKVPIATTNCTDGVGELMGLKENQSSNSENLFTEVGIITPTVFKGNLSILTSTENSHEDHMLMKGMKDIIHSNNFYKDKNIVDGLLNKFKVEIIAEDYLKESKNDL